MEVERMIKKAEEEEEKRVIVAVDESEESMHALSWCLSNLCPKNTNNTLVLLYVKPPPPVYSSLDAPGYLLAGEHVIKSMEKYGRDLATSVMARAEAVYNRYNSNVKVEKKVGAGDAREVITVAVEKLQADVLVMGSHDYGFIKRTLLGSVSDYCSKHVRCPVVVVKRPRNA